MDISASNRNYTESETKNIIAESICENKNFIRNRRQDLLCLLRVVVGGGTDGRGSLAFGLPEQSFPNILFNFIFSRHSLTF